MKYPSNVWKQIKGISVEKLISALEKDGWIRDTGCKKSYAYYKPKTRDRVTIHYHPGKTYRPGMLKKLLEAIGWDEKDLKRLKLIKKK